MNQVIYAECNDYDRQKTAAALNKVLLPLFALYGGVSGKKVMIKPNFLEWKGPEIPVCVSPEMLVVLCRILRENGAAKIAVIENPAVRSAPVIVQNMGIAAELAELEIEVANCADYRFIDLPENCTFRRIEAACEYRDFDLVIDFAKAKTHGMMTLTLAVKNLFGLIRGSERLGWHLAVGRDYNKFADMLLDIYLLVKPHISLLDAVIGMEGNGPGSGDPVKLGFIAASDDALALDASVSPRLGVDDLLLIHRAKKRGLIAEYVENGEIPGINPVKLPEPPEMKLEWGVYFPVKLRNFLRKFMVSKPVADKQRCIGCGMCAKMCPPQSLKIVNGKPEFKLSNCIRCYCCQEHCPCGAITTRRTLLMKFADNLEKLIRKLRIW